MKVENWDSFSESRSINPFATSESALSECQFRWLRDSEFVKNQSEIRPIEDTALFQDTTFAPGFKLSINHEQIEEEAGRPVAQLLLSIIAGDKSLWNQQIILSTTLAEAPSDYDVPHDVISQFSGARGLEFGIVITPQEGISAEKFKASLSGEIIASKFFTLAPSPAFKGGFPISCKEPPFPPGISEDAMWYIHWQDDNPNNWARVETEQVFTVVINKACSDKLLRIQYNNPVGKVFWSSLAAEVYLEVAQVVLTRPGIERPAQGTKSFLSGTISSLENVTKRRFEDLVTEFSNDGPDIDAITKLRSNLHAYLGIKDEIVRNRFTQ